jgi:3-hydroxyacyl-[acyl-carrier-protein] dehydratase
MIGRFGETPHPRERRNLWRQERPGGIGSLLIGERKMDIQEILSVIPHRYPFLLVDRVTELIPGEKAAGYKNVSINEPYFQGHFPGEPVMPGVLIVEALAQVGALAVLSQEQFKGKLAFFAGIDRFRFKQVVRPGDRLDLAVTLTALRGRLGKGQAEARVDGKIVAAGELWFAVEDAAAKSL